MGSLLILEGGNFNVYTHIFNETRALRTPYFENVYFLQFRSTKKFIRRFEPCCIAHIINTSFSDKCREEATPNNS